MLYRTSYFPGLGWLMKREDWSPVSIKWPLAASTGWDHWIRRTTNSGGGRECIVPEVPRTRHIGADGGTNVNAAEQKRLSRMAFATVPAPLPEKAQRWPSVSSLPRGGTRDKQGGYVLLPIESMFGDMNYLMEESYDRALVALIAGAPILNGKQAGEDQHAITPNANGGDVVVYTRETYRSLASRMGLWPGEPRAIHRGVIVARREGGEHMMASGSTKGVKGIKDGNDAKNANAAMARLDGPDRLVLVDRRAGAALLEAAGKGSEAWRPAVGITMAAARKGQSCDDRCRTLRKRCSERELEFANNCEALIANFPCEAGCGHQIGDEIPCYVSDPLAPTFRQCLVTEQRMPQCHASHPSTSRLCACI